MVACIHCVGKVVVFRYRNRRACVLKNLVMQISNGA